MSGIPSAGDVQEAAKRLRGRVRSTPLVIAEPGLFSKSPVILKLEFLQHTGSFKARGALNAMLTTQRVKELGVVTASGGNHARALAWAAPQVGAKATIFIPEVSPRIKVEAVRSLGADVKVFGAQYADAVVAAEEFSRTTGAILIHAYDNPAVVAGQGTVGLELIEQAEAAGNEIHTVLVAAGGGGLSAGIAIAVEKQVKLVVVEPVGCPTWHMAQRAGQPVDVEVGGEAADALGAGRLGDIAFHALSNADAESILIQPESIRHARRTLWGSMRLAVEPGGAAAIGALMEGAYQPAEGEQVAAVVCGANADPGDLEKPSGTGSPS